MKQKIEPNPIKDRAELEKRMKAANKKTERLVALMGRIRLEENVADLEQESEELRKQIKAEVREFDKYLKTFLKSKKLQS